MPRRRAAPRYIVRARLEGSAKSAPIDVSDRVLRLQYEDVEKGTDKLSIEVDNDKFQNLSNPIFAQGTILEFSYGYADGVMSPFRTAIITKVTGGGKLKIEAKGQVYLLDTEKKIRKFENVKRSDVAKKIAEEHGFASTDVQVIEDTEVIHGAILQTKLTDAQFLRDLANKEGFEFRIAGGKFYFRSRDLKQPPIREWVYFIDPNEGDIITEPNIENDITAKPGTITAKGIDPKTKKVIEKKADNTTTKGRPGLADFVGINSKSGQREPRIKRTAQSAVVSTTEKSQKGAERNVVGAYKQIQLTAIKLTFTNIGDPGVSATDIVSIKGIDAASGRYYLTKVVHTLQKEYQMGISCSSDGKSKPDSPTAVKSQASIAKATAAGNKGGVNSNTKLTPVKVVDARSGATRTVFRPPR
ncbi:hypothetical protein EKK58_05745 [Candidatus Dependentiae bacterium]|nr:MAG: hypothetical protein EKK58_05745 [Candidatus Dependentiae bacterium]